MSPVSYLRFSALGLARLLTPLESRPVTEFSTLAAEQACSHVRPSGGSGARGYQILVDIAARQCGGEAADVLAAPFVLGDQAELAELFVASGISGANVTLHEGSIQFPSVQEFIRIEVKGSPLADMVSDDVMEILAAESESALAEFVVPSGEIVMPMDAHIVTANKT
jgi:hypothetical protein